MSRAEKKSAARLAAVQALYQMELAATGVHDVVAQFESHWIGREIEGDQYKPAELALFRQLVEGVLEKQKLVDLEIDSVLSKGWPLRRIEAVMRAALRAGAYELMFMEHVPPKVTISEYVDITRAFFGGDETNMVNAVLDRLARDLRGAELEAAKNS